LILLAPDASGLASFKLHSFSDTASAADFIQRSFIGHAGTGVIAFWAMTSKPAPSAASEVTVEAMVMIRDELQPDVVYPFSFVDLATAHNFLKYEMNTGLGPERVLVYWAVPVQLMVSEDGQLQLTPDVAPPAGEEQPETPPAWHGTTEPRIAVHSPHLVDLPASPHLVELPRPLVSTADDPIEAIFHPAGPELRREALDAPVQVPVVVTAPERPIIAEPARTEVAAVAVMTRESSPPLQDDFQRVLQVRRWEVQEGPFQGFQSPPGRF
jgi:hypothetical protein